MKEHRMNIFGSKLLNSIINKFIVYSLLFFPIALVLNHRTIQAQTSFSNEYLSNIDLDNYDVTSYSNFFDSYHSFSYNSLDDYLYANNLEHTSAFLLPMSFLPLLASAYHGYVLLSVALVAGLSYLVLVSKSEDLSSETSDEWKTAAKDASSSEDFSNLSQQSPQDDKLPVVTVDEKFQGKWSKMLKETVVIDHNRALFIFPQDLKEFEETVSEDWLLEEVNVMDLLSKSQISHNEKIYGKPEVFSPIIMEYYTDKIHDYLEKRFETSPKIALSLYKRLTQDIYKYQKKWLKDKDHIKSEAIKQLRTIDKSLAEKHGVSVGGLIILIYPVISKESEDIDLWLKKTRIKAYHQRL